MEEAQTENLGSSVVRLDCENEIEKFWISVKDGFFENAGKSREELAKFKLGELMQDANLIKYLHNETGPAFQLISVKGKLFDEKKYFIDGKLCTDEQIERIEHESNFTETFEETLRS